MPERKTLAGARWCACVTVAQRSLRAALAFALPDSCLHCGGSLSSDERHLCAACRLKTVCGRSAYDGPRAAPLRETRYALPFDGPAGDLVRALKYGGRTSVADELALAAMPVAFALLLDRHEAIVPVPLHAARRRERGLNQTVLLAAGLGRGLGLPVLDALVRTRPTRSQTELSPEQRASNVRGAFRSRGPLAGRSLLLLDDVVTTGATLSAAATAAYAAGASRVAAFAIAGLPGDGRAASESG